jgi:peptidoglycan/LPS O-acetylase OafA/YrhL
MQGMRHQPSLQALGLVPGVRRRAWSVLLVLALALASFLHVAHSHEADAPSLYKQHCTYCGMFDRGGAPPPASLAVLPAEPAPTFVFVAPHAPVPGLPLRSALQPRAPPSPQA